MYFCKSERAYDHNKESFLTLGIILKKAKIRIDSAHIKWIILVNAKISQMTLIFMYFVGAYNFYFGNLT